MGKLSDATSVLLNDLASSIRRTFPETISETSKAVQSAAEYLLVLGALWFAFNKTNNFLLLMFFIGLLTFDLFVSIRRLGDALHSSYEKGARGGRLALVAVIHVGITVLGFVTVLWVGTDLGRG